MVYPQYIPGKQGWIPQISLDTAKQYILPQTQDIDFDQTKHRLMENGLLVGNMWTSLSLQDRPDDGDYDDRYAYDDDLDKHDENRALSLNKVFNQITDCCVFKSPGQARKPTLEYTFTGNLIDPSHREAGSRPYAFGRLLHDHPEYTPNILTSDEAPSTERWENIAVAVEYQQIPQGSSGLARHLSPKMLWTLRKMMGHDPRRRFVYGITFEKTKARLWYYNRSVMCVTEAFDICEDNESFIYVLLSLQYAPVAALGWDPTMRLVIEQGNIYYDITVHHLNGTEMVKSVWRTVELLSNDSARSLRGHGTRVYKAYQIDEQGRRCGEIVALKDTWTVDDGRQSEEEILLEILENVPEEAQHYFPSLVPSAWGKVLIDGVADDTGNSMMRGLMTQLKDSFDEWTGKSRQISIINKYLLNYHLEQETFKFGKVHRRMVFKEVGTPVTCLQDMPTVLRVLIDVVQALKILYELGYVHRDVSGGNVLLVGSRGVLIDYETVTKIDSLKPEDRTGLRTANHIGTPDFMSTEISVNGYDHVAQPEYDSEEDEPPPIDFSQQPAPFVYNQMHDVESVWWIFVWIIVWNVVPLSMNETNKQSLKTILEEIEAQVTVANEIFGRGMESYTRNNLIRDHFMIRTSLEHISLKQFIPYLSRGAGFFRKHYGKAEKGVNQGYFDGSALLNIHGPFIEILKSALNISEGVMICPISEVQRQAKECIEESKKAVEDINRIHTKHLPYYIT